MTKLVFLFRDCNKKVVRVTERGFEKTCLLYGVAPCRIAGLNGFCERALKNSLIYIEKCKNSVLYQVKVEDTLEKICARFGVLKEELCRYNQITYCYPYQVIEIPTAED